MDMKNAVKPGLEIGQLVFSIAGRDKGQYYLVYALDDAKKLVYLVDGRKRNAENPKPKNPVHLQRTNLIAADFQAKVLSGSVITSREIREFFVEFSID